MPSFRYKVLEKSGSLAEGELDAHSRGDASRRLNEKGMQVLSIEELKETEKAEKKAKSDKEGKARAKKKIEAPVENRLSSRALIQFTEEVSDLLTAGVQLDAALNSIASRSKNAVIRRVAEACYDRVRDGVPFATALRAASPSFSELYLNLVSAGEVSGALGDILRRQVAYLTTLSELRGKMASAMIYPAFLIVAVVGLSFIFMFLVIPQLKELLESSGGELPLVASAMLNAAEFIKQHWIILLISLAVAIVLLVVLLQQEVTKRWWDENMLKVPLLKKLMRTRFNVQFVETLSNLMNNGLPLVKALQLVEGTTGNRYIREQIREITDKVSEGGLLNRSMEKAGVFEPVLIDMVRIGEDTGQLAQSMTKAGNRLDREFSRSIDQIASVIQPAITVVMAVVVGTMAFMMVTVIQDTMAALRNR